MLLGSQTPNPISSTPPRQLPFQLLPQTEHLGYVVVGHHIFCRLTNRCLPADLCSQSQQRLPVLRIEPAYRRHAAQCRQLYHQSLSCILTGGEPLDLPLLPLAPQQPLLRKNRQLSLQGIHFLFQIIRVGQIVIPIEQILQDADQIVILDGGTVQAVGTHDELLAANTIYQEIYNQQNRKGGEE